METYHNPLVLVDGFSVQEHPIYQIWAGMKNRCRNKSQINYSYYGGRGITYCERWKHFANFAEDMYPTYQKGLSLDRIDSNGNYEPSNCRWASGEEQLANRKVYRNNELKVPGVTKRASGNYQARVTIKGENKHLGCFKTLEEAINAVLTAKSEH